MVQEYLLIKQGTICLPDVVAEQFHNKAFTCSIVERIKYIVDVEGSKLPSYIFEALYPKHSKVRRIDELIEFLTDQAIKYELIHKMIITPTKKTTSTNRDIYEVGWEISLNILDDTKAVFVKMWFE